MKEQLVAMILEGDGDSRFFRLCDVRFHDFQHLFHLDFRRGSLWVFVGVSARSGNDYFSIELLKPNHFFLQALWPQWVASRYADLGVVLGGRFLATGNNNFQSLVGAASGNTIVVTGNLTLSGYESPQLTASRTY